ncbi:hypothetical protein WS62_02865 [Burkholderia sp. ABCPW 14]|uniref:Peptidase n=1 Tax=Burkholderia mayonis TaxID=1385591 RepID=A0A1B4G3H8_9BURK|nr:MULTISPECIES: hypothetical protein [Burkholderia]AOJ10486.1 hypothetical protein WS71_25160 [Burkholderia mayonis]KVD76089.1 hypothetical protein WS62_02865 [Burkholderia sp. ABCPW 14]KVE53533.1 hypothetical protein WS71_05615 [Burkholderia mayonis]
MLFRSGTIRIPFEPNGKARERMRPMQRVELDPEHDRHARAALEAYADASAVEMPWLAEWMREALGGPQPDLTRCAATVERVFDLAHAWAADQPDYARAAWEHVRDRLHDALQHAPRAIARDAFETDPA